MRCDSWSSSTPKTSESPWTPWTSGRVQSGGCSNASGKRHHRRAALEDHDEEGCPADGDGPATHYLNPVMPGSAHQNETPQIRKICLRLPMVRGAAIGERLTRKRRAGATSASSVLTPSLSSVDRLGR